MANNKKEWAKEFIDSIENYRVNYLMSHLLVSEMTRFKIKSWLEFLNDKVQDLYCKIVQLIF